MPGIRSGWTTIHTRYIVRKSRPDERAHCRTRTRKETAL